MFEPLENRQLMSLTVDVRVAGGGNSATVSGPGQVINLEIWANATGVNGNGNDEGLQSLLGSLVSSNLGSAAAMGTLQFSLVSPFTGSGSTSGTQRDADGDGDLDVGNLDPASNTSNGLIMARSDTPTVSGGVVTSSGRSLKIANATFTVSQVFANGTTQLRFAPHISSNRFASNASWREDGQIRSDGGVNDTGTYSQGSVVTLTRGSGGGGGGGGGGTTPGSISGNVWKDNDADGVKDAGEVNFSGFQLYLDNNRNGLKDGTEPTTWTDGNGNYTFSSLGANVTYRVRAFPPSGWGTSFPYQPNPWHDVFVGSAQSVSGKNFGEKPLGGGGGGGGGTTAGSIAGSVFKDNNSNGTWDNGEPAFSSFQLYIDSNLNGLKDSSEPTTWSDGSGNYKFSNLPANANYRVRAFPPSGWGTSFPRSVPWHDLFVGSGQNITNKHFGERPLTSVSVGSISGRVWKDTNANGWWDGGEVAFSGFQLYIDSNWNGLKDSNESTAWTDGNGNYAFSNLSPNNTYRVRAYPPSGWGTSFPYAPNKWHDVWVGSGQNITGKNFGERPL